MRSLFSNSRALVLLGCMLCACASLSPPPDKIAPPQVITLDAQQGIWDAGITLYNQGKFLAAADLFQMAYKLKPAQRIVQNIGAAYFKAAQLPEYPDVLRLEYVRRALPLLRRFRVWLANDFGKTHDVASHLVESDQLILAAEQLEKELRRIVDPPPAVVNVMARSPGGHSS